MKALFSTLLIVLMMVMPTLLIAAVFGSNSANIKNAYLIPRQGFSVLHTSYGLPASQFEYTHVIGIEVVDNVKCLRVFFIGTEASEFDESWVAQDINGDTYVLKSFDASENDAPILLGADSAELLIRKNPKVGDVLFGGDETVTYTGVTVPKLSTGLGPFSNCIQTVEDDGDIVYYAPDFGMVKRNLDPPGDLEGWELKYIFNPKPNTVVIPLF